MGFPVFLLMFGAIVKLCPECYEEFDDQLMQCPTDSKTLTSLEPDPLIGFCLSGRYLIQSVIGRGGMGVVYKALHENLDRIVAVKMLHQYLITDAEALKRFHREAKAVSRVKNPHTVTLYDFGLTASGQPYIVMDYIEGTSLKQVLKEQGALTLERAGHIFQQVIEALACAHFEGVIHRDLKPENIMLTSRANDPEWVEVVDFGISKVKSKNTQQTYNITKVGDVCGSPPYMSPEQCIAALPIDSRSDIYSFGICLYEALAKRLPFKAKSAIEMIDCHLYANPTPLAAANPDLASCDALWALLSKALSKQPEHRQQSMEELGIELKKAIQQDLIKLSIAQNRRECFSAEALAREEKASNLANEALSALNHGVPEKPRFRNLFEVIMVAVIQLFGSMSKQVTENTTTVLANCPFCGVKTEPNIRFCVACGRNIILSTELTKLRTAAGVFTLPKSQPAKVSGELPEFSIESKLAMAGSRTIFGIPRRLIIINLLVVILVLIWVVFTQGVHVDDGHLKSRMSGRSHFL